jgi:hypothetical protein
VREVEVLVRRLYIVPADMRDLQHARAGLFAGRHVGGEALDLPGEDAEARVTAVLVGVIEQHLHAETDAEEGVAALDDHAQGRSHGAVDDAWVVGPNEPWPGNTTIRAVATRSGSPVMCTEAPTWMSACSTLSRFPS